MAKLTQFENIFLECCFNAVFFSLDIAWSLLSIFWMSTVFSFPFFLLTTWFGLKQFFFSPFGFFSSIDLLAPSSFGKQELYFWGNKTEKGTNKAKEQQDICKIDGAARRMLQKNLGPQIWEWNWILILETEPCQTETGKTKFIYVRLFRKQFGLLCSLKDGRWEISSRGKWRKEEELFFPFFCQLFKLTINKLQPQRMLVFFLLLHSACSRPADSITDDGRLSADLSKKSSGLIYHRRHSSRWHCQIDFVKFLGLIVIWKTILENFRRY